MVVALNVLRQIFPALGTDGCDRDGSYGSWISFAYYTRSGRFCRRGRSATPSISGEE